jgi:hypothetical protein
VSFNERNKAGQESESYVQNDLESRGWTVEKYGRGIFSPGLNRVLTDWRDTYSAPCYLGWNPDFVIWTPELRQLSNLFCVDVKRVTNNFDVARRALDTYVAYERAFNVPVVIVFHLPGDDLRAIAAGKAHQNAIPRHGNSEAGSGQPYYIIDPGQMSPLDRFFGEKRS